ncbi:hypothetical protein GCM10027296_20100 [Chitinimonas naiadis]
MKLFSLLFMSLPLSLAAKAPDEVQNGRLLEATQILASVTRQPVRPYATHDFGRARNPQARSVLLATGQVVPMLKAVRARLPDGLIAFAGTSNSLAQPSVNGVELVVAEGKDQFDSLRIARTSAPNYDQSTEALIAQLRHWHASYGIDIWHVESDTIQLTLRALPKDVPAFARAVYAFCPDTVDQGVGSVDALATSIRQTRALYLWWD